MRLVAIAVVAIAVAIAGVHYRSEAQGMTGVVPLQYFGMHIHRAVKPEPGNRPSPWPAVRFGAWRLWDAYAAWTDLEPARGNWQFETLDEYVAMAQRAGVEIVLPLGLTPTWASARPDERSGYAPGNAAEARDIEDWRNYVRRVASRYKGRIRIYELWNEVNEKNFYSGSVEQLVELARVAYETLKQVDPENVLISPSMVGGGRSLQWMDSYFSAGGGNYADIISYHFYIPKTPPEAMIPLARDVQSVLKKHNLLRKPLWNTETGYWIANDPNSEPHGAAGRDWLRLNDEQGRAYVARVLLLNWANGVSRVFWYAWDNLDLGLIRNDTLGPRPAAQAYDRVAAWLIGSGMGPCEESRGVWRCAVHRPFGTTDWVMWSVNGSTDFSVPREWKVASVERLDGSTVQPKERLVGLSEAPLLLRSTTH